VSRCFDTLHVLPCLQCTNLRPPVTLALALLCAFEASFSSRIGGSHGRALQGTTQACSTLTISQARQFVCVESFFLGE
jgi:hypothetical protein